MCGYFANQFRQQEEQALLAALERTLTYPKGQWYQRTVVPGLITARSAGYEVSEAMWWYALRKEEGRWQRNEDITSFNARNLDNRLWKDAIRTRRGIVIASEIGEAQGRDHYLMRSKTPLVMGVVYRDWPQPEGAPVRSMALVTRPPHPRFSRYHSKSIPCFLPLDVGFLKSWLDPTITDSTDIHWLLDHPKIYNDLDVVKVKTYKRAEPLAEPERLEKDVDYRKAP